MKEMHILRFIDKNTFSLNTKKEVGYEIKRILILIHISVSKVNYRTPFNRIFYVYSRVIVYLKKRTHTHVEY